MTPSSARPASSAALAEAPLPAGGPLRHDPRPAGEAGADQDRGREQRVAPRGAEIAFEIGEMLGEHLVAEIGHAQEQVELGRQPQPEQQQEGERGGLVWRVPGQREQQDRGRRDREVMVDHGRGRGGEAPPAGDTRRACGAVGAGDRAHQETHLVPAPDQDRGGEAGIGAVDAGVARLRPDQQDRRDRGEAGERQAGREGLARPAVEPYDRCGADEPHQQREEQRGDRHQAGTSRTVAGATLRLTGVR